LLIVLRRALTLRSTYMLKKKKEARHGASMRHVLILLAALVIGGLVAITRQSRPPHAPCRLTSLPEWSSGSIIGTVIIGIMDIRQVLLWSFQLLFPMPRLPSWRPRQFWCRFAPSVAANILQ
jgi:hypothetical protein